MHHPTTLVHVVCLCHLFSCLRARVYVFFRNRIESYNCYTCNMQETWKNMLQPELASLLSRSPSIFRAHLHVCLLQQEWWRSRLSVRLQGRLHCRYQPSFTICNVKRCVMPLGHVPKSRQTPSPGLCQGQRTSCPRWKMMLTCPTWLQDPNKKTKGKQNGHKKQRQEPTLNSHKC